MQVMLIAVASLAFVFHVLTTVNLLLPTPVYTGKETHICLKEEEATGFVQTTKMKYGVKYSKGG